MQVLHEWGGESRKRAAEESIEKSSRKRTRDDDNGRRQSTGIVANKEYEIRGSATIDEDPFSNQSASSPVATEPLPSPPLPSIHPDRRANIFNATPGPGPGPAPLQNKRDYPWSTLSRSPEHIDDPEPEEQRSKPLHATSSISPPNLQIDTVRPWSSLDPRSPDYLPAMTSHCNENPRDSPSHDSRKPSIDSHRHNSNPPSRRKSDVMPPPPNATKITRSENSTPKATLPPANRELERRQSATNQPHIPLLDSLNDFAQSIMSAASLTVRRDLTKQQAVGQQKERDRQSKFKSTFLTLIEDAEAKVESVEKISMGIEKQIDLGSQAQSKIANTLAAQLQKAEILDAPPSARDRGRFKDDLADLKADLKAARKDIDYLNREAVMPDGLHKKLRGLATKDDLRGVITKDELHRLPKKDELRRVTSDEVRKHVTEALIPTEKKLASLTVEDANLNQKIKGVEAVTQTHHEMARKKDQQQSPRFERLGTSLKDIQTKLSHLELIVQEQKEDYATVKIDLGAQDKVLTDLDAYVRRDSSNDDPSLDKLVMRNSRQIQLLQQDYETLNEAVRQAQDLQAASKIDSSPQISQVSGMADTRIEEEVKLIRSDVDALKLEQQCSKSIRDDLDAVRSDREKVILIRTDLDSLINEEKLKDVGLAEGFEEIEQGLKKQQEELAGLRNEIRLVKQSQASQTVPNHPPTPPFASVSTSPHESDHQKLQDVEMGLRKLTNTTQGLELFVNSQQQKFDGLTSDRVVQSMVHQMQQMYPQHPGNLVVLVNQTVARQARVDNYLSSNLKDRLASIESQIAARVDKDSKIEEITQFTAESRKILLATTNSLKQDIEGLRQAVLTTRSQELSGYDNRIDELADRVTAVEARYVKAIGDFQINQADLVRNVTHLQYRNGNHSSRNTPGELTTLSRSSKSVEPNRSTISSENIDGSDNSDTPLSQRSNREIDREERGPFDPNLKRKAVDADDEDEDEGGEGRPANAKKVAKRRNVSGRNPFS